MIANRVAYYEFGTCRIDILNHEIIKDGKPIDLAHKTFEILCFLVQNQGKVVRKDELLDRFWEQQFLDETNLTQQIYRIRKAIKNEETGENYIETIPKFGYKFVGEVEERADYSDVASRQFPGQKNGNNDTLKTVDRVDFSASKSSGEGPSNAEDRSTNESPGLQQQPQARSRKGILGGFIALIIGLFALSYFYLFPTFSTKNSEIRSIAILPFEQIGGKANEKLGLGIADTLISKLSGQRKVSVLPTSTIIKFVESGNGTPIQIGKKLGVDAVLTGTIQRDGESVRINVQLVTVSDKRPVWAEKFDARFSDIFSLQDKVALHVAENLPLDGIGDPRPKAINKYTSNIEAYQSYTMGIFYWSKRSEEGFTKAAKHFTNAVDKDPNFVLANAYLADVYAISAHYGYEFVKSDLSGAKSKAKSLAEKALQLDPDCNEAMSALALYYLSENKRGKAVELLKSAINVNPNDSNSHRRIAWFYANNGEIDKAVAASRLAQNLDPQSLFTNSFLMMLLTYSERPDEAIRIGERALEIDPDSAWIKWRIAEAWEYKGEYDKALDCYEKLAKEHPKETLYRLDVSHVYVKTGKRSMAKEIIEEVLAGNKKINKYRIGIAYTLLGEKQKAMKWHREVLNEIPDEYYPAYLYDYDLNSLRDHEEFEQLLSSKKSQQGY